jgi:hypothetical protein
VGQDNTSAGGYFGAGARSPWWAWTGVGHPAAGGVKDSVKSEAVRFGASEGRDACAGGEEHPMTRARGRRPLRTVLLVALGLVLGAAASTSASHMFSDVPTAAIYHAATEWLANRGVTLGCATGLYCPNEFVTRGQMALFMQRLGAALTPTLIAQTGGGAADIDALPIVCQTALSAYAPTFPQRAIARSSVSIQPAIGGLQFVANHMVSTDGGATWSNPFFPNASTVQSALSASGVDTLYHSSSLDLNPGMTYLFGVRLQRAAAGTDNIGGYGCQLTVEIVNRNAASTPLGRPGRGATVGR